MSFMFTSAIWLTAYEPALEICYLLQHRNLDLLAVTEITLLIGLRQCDPNLLPNQLPHGSFNGSNKYTIQYPAAALSNGDEH